MALSMVRITKWRAKWEEKLQNATENYLERHKGGNRWALIVLPFTVVMREALESIVFIGGVGVSRLVIHFNYCMNVKTTFFGFFKSFNRLVLINPPPAFLFQSFLVSLQGS